MMAIFLSAIANAQLSTVYSFDKKVPLPGDGGYDYLSVDTINHHLFISHGTSVDVVDLRTDIPVGSINSMKGVHGIALATEVNKGFISDGRDNAVVVFDLTTFKKLKIIKITGTGPDAIMYDPFSKNVVAFCGESNNACVVDINSLTQTATIDLGGAPEFAVSDGRGLVYNNLEDKSSLAVIDAASLKVIRRYPLAPCRGPTGLALDNIHQRLFTVCRENKGMSVVDINSGVVVTTVPIGAGVDAVVYDASSKLIFCSNGEGTVSIIKQESPDKYSLVQTLPTVPRARTMALDPETGKIYLSAASFIGDTRNVVPGSFAIMVYKRNK
ncbi:MAG: YncE family protein [Ginsengibacter sp.]